jgi:two-component system, NtrC family, sensor histidine kinase PilS
MHKDKPFALEIDCPADLMVTFDPDHLQQILHNICANGLRYALKQTSAKPALGLKAQISGTRVQLDIIDNGGGVTEEQARHLFEPFYTTEHNGTGLGLYLCRELCEANQTSIQYQPIPSGSCFRLMLRTDKHP